MCRFADEQMRRCADVQVCRCADVQMWGCADGQMCRCAYAQLCRSANQMCRYADNQMRRCTDAQMLRCADAQIRRYADVQMCRCADVQAWEELPGRCVPGRNTLRGGVYTQEKHTPEVCVPTKDTLYTFEGHVFPSDTRKVYLFKRDTLQRCVAPGEAHSGKQRVHKNVFIRRRAQRGQGFRV